MPRKYIINFVGDVMLGRLIDQLFPMHVHEPSEARIARSFAALHGHLDQYGPRSPWGDTLALFEQADLNIINLETSVTTSSRKWPNKVFNYRMHPQNLEAFRPAKISYATLANNRTLDFSEEGLRDTVAAVEGAGIAFAGAGTSQEKAEAPATLSLSSSLKQEGKSEPQRLQIWAAADHLADWSNVPGFSFIDYSPQTRTRLKKLVHETSSPSMLASTPLKVFSVHWGPNYSWKPSEEIQSLAHFLVEECGIDIVHGHSSHHVQGVEVYKLKLIIYGCGDFVDDYALTPEYRNDISAIWRVNVIREQSRLKLYSLEIFPTRIKTFQAQRLQRDEADFDWLTEKLRKLCAEFATHVEENIHEDNPLCIKL